MTTARPVVLISGASSGFGALAAEELVRRGWRVFGTSRQPQQHTADGWEMVELDVRDEGSVRRCVDMVQEKAGRIDVLVNNAGYVLNGFAEEASDEEVEAIFATNFFGLVRLTDAVLPMMRARGSGKIINISSAAGLIGVPYRAFYAASKYAVEGYSETLHYELAAFGICVSLIEPGFFRTNLDQAGIKCRRVIEDYDSIRGRVDDYFHQGVRNGGDPAEAARLIAEVAESGRPRLRYRVGTDSKWLLRLRALLPQRLYTYGVRKRFKLFR